MSQAILPDGTPLEFITDPNWDGAQFADRNSRILQALATANSGPTEPPVTYGGMLWHDTANAQLKFRNADNNAWIDPLSAERAELDDLIAQLGTAIGNAGDLVAAEVTALWQHVVNQAANSAAALAGFDLGAINAILNTGTVVDYFIYDTSMDSDGGAWRNRCQHTSWYREPLNTATRGGRREFPAVALIVAESNKVTIYDGDDPDLPMWMEFLQNLSGQYLNLYNDTPTITSVSMLNGVLCVGSIPDVSNRNGATLVNFLADAAKNHGGAAGHFFSEPVSGRNDTNVITQDNSLAIIDKSVNDVAMTVLPDAPIDPATGLPVPTIAVATNGGLSIIENDAVVYSNTARTQIRKVTWLGKDRLFLAGATTNFRYTLMGYSNGAFSVLREIGIFTEQTPYLNMLNEIGYVCGLGMNSVAFSGYLNGRRNLAQFVFDETNPNATLGTAITSTYNTGWMVGAIKGAFLSDTDTNSLVGGTDADRSVNNNPLTVNGTVTRSPVATGAELVGYSGFSSSNYIEQPYNSSLDFGTGDFCVMGWVKGSIASDIILQRSDGTTTGQLYLFGSSSGQLSVRAGGDTNDIVTTATLTTGANQFVVLRKSGVLSVYVNGKLDSSISHTKSLTASASSVFRVGQGIITSAPLAEASLALLRISATAPTAEQIKKIYEDEKVLFQDNAACTLYGTSDAVTSLCADSGTGLLHVITPESESVFSGLARVDQEANTGGWTHIAAQNGIVVKG